MPRRGGILMTLGLVLALVTGGLVYYMLRQTVATAAMDPAPETTPVPTRPIPVAAQALSAGTTITDTDVTTREYPEDLVPVGVITQTEGLVGQMVVEPVEGGAFFRPADLATSGEGALSDLIPQSRVVMAFPVDDLLSRSLVVREGDHVDLLLSLDLTQADGTTTRVGKATSYTVQNIQVRKLVRDVPTEENPNPPPTAILFEMSPQDAVIAKFVKDSGGTLDLSLRSAADSTPYETQAINQDFLIDTYGLQAPQSGSQQP
jgi:pilus assembly protein CpaB